jgi:hypothetical protein
VTVRIHGGRMKIEAPLIERADVKDVLIDWN